MPGRAGRITGPRFDNASCNRRNADWTTLGEHMPPAHQAMANRTPDWVRGQAAKVGVATAAYVERLLTGRDHIEQGVRSCLGILRLATRYPGEQREAACVRAMVAGASSSGFVEQLLKSGRPLADSVAEDGVGHHGNTTHFVGFVSRRRNAGFVVPATTIDDRRRRSSNKDPPCTSRRLRSYTRCALEPWPMR